MFVQAHHKLLYTLVLVIENEFKGENCLGKRQSTFISLVGTPCLGESHELPQMYSGNVNSNLKKRYRTGN